MKQFSKSISPQTRIRAGVAALAFGLMSAATAVHAHEGDPAGHQHGHGMGMHGPLDSEKEAKHAEKMIGHVAPDATPEQKAKLTEIHNTAKAELKQLHEKRRAAHQQTMKLLSQPKIDRAAVEQARQAEMQVADQLSKRMTQAMTDSAEVLTPAQRAKAAEQMQQRETRMKERAQKREERMQKRQAERAATAK
ncbi:MAG: hypothetical protein K0S28_1780 [Paucimonas sp.]|jgi:Spy/CpxP family protein refolding chaperone|nr:hypothetical protein [Paucimonas sp.]